MYCKNNNVTVQYMYNSSSKDSVKSDCKQSLCLKIAFKGESPLVPERGIQLLSGSTRRQVDRMLSSWWPGYISRPF